MFAKSEKLTRRVSSRLFLAGAVLVLVFLGLAAPGVTYASWWDVIFSILAWPVYGVAWLLGELLSVIIYFLIIVAQYSEIIDAEPVKQGWVIVRDLCNMFFVIVLLVIAFGTVLKIETYHYKRLLPKFLLMAILINFSKTICGLFIDFAQVIMLTFVAGFSSIASGNLITSLRINELLTFTSQKPEEAYEGNFAKIFGSAVLALIMVTISLIVVVLITIVLVFRIVALWILVILSPLAYLLSVVPAGQSYASKWWQAFTKYVIVGPVLAFFLWLSLTTATNVQQIATTTPIGQGGKPKVGLTQMGTVESLGGFIIGICLLIGSLVAAQQLGVAGGKMAGDWAGKIQQGAVGKYGPTPMRWARERFEAFQGRRTAERREKAAVFGDRMYGTYKTVTTAPRAAFRVGWETTRGLIRGEETPEKIQKREDKIRERGEKTAHREELLRAQMTGVYSREGKDYHYNPKADRYETKKGEVAMYQGKAISKPKGWKADVALGWQMGMSKATGIRNAVNDERIAKKQKSLTDAGLSTAQLAKVLTNSAASRDERLAAALTLATKEGFETRDKLQGRNQINKAKELMKNEPVLSKKFDDIIDKKFAHLNYDLSTEEGKRKFREREEQGIFDAGRLHHGAYRDKDTIETLKDLWGVGFATKIGSVANIGKSYRDSSIEGLVAAKNNSLFKGDKLYNETTGELNPFSKAIAKVHGDVIKAFNNSADETITNFDETSKEALTKFIETAKPADLDNFDNNNLKINEVKKNFKLDEFKSHRVVEAVEDAIAKGIDGSKLASMQRSGQSPEFIARSIGIMKNLDNKKYQQQIVKNNVLVNIKGIAPVSAAKTTSKTSESDENKTDFDRRNEFTKEDFA